MTDSREYKRQIMDDLAAGNVDSIDDDNAEVGAKYDNFDDFAHRSSRAERRQLFGRSFHPDRVPTSQMEPELQKAIAQIEPHERDDVAREFFKHLKHRGLKESDLKNQLYLSTDHASRMNADDLSKLATFAYHNHPDIFPDVLADKPAMLKFMSNPLVGAAFGAIAAKWLRGRQ
jgi:hypothetical protein